MKLEELKQKIMCAGVIGAGGAGFPTHAKLNPKANVVILNCSECEPLLRVDRQLMVKYTDEILKAVKLITDSLEAEKAIIGIKSHYTAAIKSVKENIDKYDNIQLKELQDFYPVGDEVVLVYETTGRIVPEGSIPIAVGAVVINVETALNIYNAVYNNENVIRKYVTVTGAVNTPVALKVPIGISIEKLIEIAGGASIDDYEILMGGPMTGKIVSSNDVILKTTKAIMVLPKEHAVILKKKSNISISMKRLMSVCSQCQMCTDICPRHLLNHSIEPHKIMNNIANGITHNIDTLTSTMLCCNCGLCEMYSCNQSLNPRTLIGEFKSKLRQNGIKNPHNKSPKEANMMREVRKVPMERLISRLALTKYNVDAPLKEDEIKSYSVKIPLRQHIGVEASAVVSKGDKVLSGQVIGKIEDGKLGSYIHASIDGVVVDLNSTSITIEARGDMIG